MLETKDLPPNLCHVRLLLACSNEHPHGDPGEGYDLLVPLSDTGRSACEHKRNAASRRLPTTKRYK
jgi:hypothetical protein